MDKIGLDKVLHCVLSFVISAILSLVIYAVWMKHPVLSGFIGFIITMLVGLGKEIYDSRRRYGFDCWDLLADAIGAVVVVPMMLLV